MGVSVLKKLLLIASTATLLAGCAHGFGHSHGGHSTGSSGYHSSSSWSSGASSSGHSYSAPAPGAPTARPVPPPSPQAPVISGHPARPPPVIGVRPYRPPPLAYGYAAAPERPVSVVLDLLDALAQGFAEALATTTLVVVEPLPPVPPPPSDPSDAPDDPRPPAPDYYGADLGAEICDDLLPGAPLPRGCTTENLAKAKPAPTPPAASESDAAGSIP